jgi:hypothetical protein
VKICAICGKIKYNLKKMTKKNIIIAILTFIIGFGSTFYIIRTYFPKHKVEKTAQVTNTMTKTEK